MTVNERASKALAGRWRAGMVVLWDDGAAEPFPERIDFVHQVTNWAPELRPVGLDMTDPATLGAFLAVVREAWNDDGAYAARGLNGDWHVWDGDAVHQESPERYGRGGPTEAEALVAALEAAPR